MKEYVCNLFPLSIFLLFVCAFYVDNVTAPAGAKAAGRIGGQLLSVPGRTLQRSPSNEALNTMRQGLRSRSPSPRANTPNQQAMNGTRSFHGGNPMRHRIGAPSMAYEPIFGARSAIYEQLWNATKNAGNGLKSTSKTLAEFATNGGAKVARGYRKANLMGKLKAFVKFVKSVWNYNPFLKMDKLPPHLTTDFVMVPEHMVGKVPKMTIRRAFNTVRNHMRKGLEKINFWVLSLGGLSAVLYKVAAKSTDKPHTLDEWLQVLLQSLLTPHQTGYGAPENVAEAKAGANNAWWDFYLDPLSSALSALGVKTTAVNVAGKVVQRSIIGPVATWVVGWSLIEYNLKKISSHILTGYVFENDTVVDFLERKEVFAPREVREEMDKKIAEAEAEFAAYKAEQTKGMNAFQKFFKYKVDEDIQEAHDNKIDDLYRDKLGQFGQGMSDTQDGDSAVMQYFGGNSSAAVKYLLASFWEECEQERPELQKLTALGRQFSETKNNVKDTTKAAFLSAKDVAMVKIDEIKAKLPQTKPPTAPKKIIIDPSRKPVSTSDPYDQPEVARRRGLRRKRAVTKEQTTAGKQEETNPDKILEDLKSKFQSHMRKSVFDYFARRLYQILALKACENPSWSQDLSEEAFDKKLHVEPTGCPVLPRPDDVSDEEFKQLQYATRAQALLIQEGLTDKGFKSIVTQMEYNVKNSPKNGDDSDVDVCTEEGRKAVDELFPLHFAPAGAPSVNCSPPDSEFNKWRSNLNSELGTKFANPSAIPNVSILGLESDGIKRMMEELEKLLKEIEADPDIPQAEKDGDKREFENMKREAEAILAAGDKTTPEITPSKKAGSGKNAGSKTASGTNPPAGKKTGHGNNG